jgi:hypothetical protein
MEQARGTSQLPTFSIIYGLENTLVDILLDRLIVSGRIGKWSLGHDSQLEI